MQDFTLTDKEGNEHLYEVNPHPTKQGSLLMLQICGLLSEPALQAIRLFVGEMEDGHNPGDVDIGAILDKADFDKLGGSLRTALLALEPDDLQMFFAHTTRDGQNLANDASYNSAFQGNWGEFMKALWKIIKANGFLDFLPIMPQT